MHHWGDENVDWKGINDCTSYIGKNLLKWGRCNVWQYKEKYGTVRVYMGGFGWTSLHNITHPGYAFSKYPKWLWNLDCIILSKIIPVLFNWIIVPYHKWLYKKLYSDMIKKYPHLKKEILYLADYYELLKKI